MNEAQVNVYDYLCGECEIYHCKHNTDGVCDLYPFNENQHKEFAEWATDRLPMAYMICPDAELDDDRCPNCGDFLEQRKEYRGEWWGVPSFETILVCPNCD